MADDKGTAGAGQRLRWWQEPAPVLSRRETVAAAREAVSPVLVDEAPVAKTVDIGEELELEAVRRSAAVANGERIVISLDSRKAVLLFRRRTLGLAGLSSTVLAIFVIFLRAPALFFLPFLPLLECAILYTFLAKRYYKTSGPALTITDAGLEINTIAYRLGLIRWQEIESLRPHGRMNKGVGIKLSDTKSVCTRLSRVAASTLRVNEFCGAPTILLAEAVLPLNSAALLAKIEAFRAARGV